MAKLHFYECGNRLKADNRLEPYTPNKEPNLKLHVKMTFSTVCMQEFWRKSHLAPEKIISFFSWTSSCILIHKSKRCIPTLSDAFATKCNFIAECSSFMLIKWKCFETVIFLCFLFFEIKIWIWNTQIVQPGWMQRQTWKLIHSVHIVDRFFQKLKF